MGKMTKDQELEYLRGEVVRANTEKTAMTRQIDGLKAKAEAYAIFGDLMQTIALLPMVETLSVQEMTDRIEVAMMLQGYPHIGSQGNLIVSGLLMIICDERDAMLASFQHTRENRRRGDPRCECAMCRNEEASLGAIRKYGPPQSEPHYGASLVNSGICELTDEARKRVSHQTTLLANLIGDMAPEANRGGSSAGHPLLLALLSAMSGRPMGDLGVIEF